MSFQTENNKTARFIRENRKIFVDMYNNKHYLPGPYTYHPVKNVVSVKPVDQYSKKRKTGVLFLVDNEPICVMTFTHAMDLVKKDIENV